MNEYNGIFLVGEAFCHSLLFDHIWRQMFGKTDAEEQDK